MKLLIGLLFVALFSLPFTTTAATPCSDRTYVDLKQKPLNSMTDREFEIFRSKDSACNNYMSTMQLTNSNESMNNKYWIWSLLFLVPLLLL
ncbi:MAG: hypothetical protein OEZ58_00195 [Gammaproteobacteria bacterium]|nr:hypothetical protein [Gammaproteobacteria bacterium]